ncbi:MAG: hypothetical protein HY749_18955 [Gammaproteobacteria bacterium]|nr:hypothetical protein [Gammaproteobacteria bacterium]
MERIKQALEQAREERVKVLGERTSGPLFLTDEGPGADARLAQAIRRRSPVNQLPPERQTALISAGQVLSLGAGETLLTAGESNDYVHYLLEGALAIATEFERIQTLYAYQDAALLPVDEPGTKSHTVTAELPSRVFRITQQEINRQTEAAAAAPVPTELYAETFTGQQLAELVSEINADHESLTPPVDPAPAAAPVDDEVKIGDRTLSFQIDPAFVEPPSEPPEFTPDELDLVVRPATGDELAQIIRDFEIELRRQFESIRNQERARAQAQMKSYAGRVHRLAEQQMRAKMDIVRGRYQVAYAEKERRLRERYEQLITLTNKVARQKAAINQARRELEEKLRIADQVHRDLSRIGLTVTNQLDVLEDMIPAGDAGTGAG